MAFYYDESGNQVGLENLADIQIQKQLVAVLENMRQRNDTVQNLYDQFIDEFAGQTDRDSGTAEYDRDHATDAYTSVETVDENYETGGDTDEVADDSDNTVLAQSFEIATAGNLVKMGIMAKGPSASLLSIGFRVETDNTNKPSGTLVSADAFASVTISDSSYSFREVSPFNPVPLAASTKYWLRIKSTNITVDTLNWQSDTSSPTYANGSFSRSADEGSTWTTDSGADGLFRIYTTAVETDGTLITKNHLASVQPNRIVVVAHADLSASGSSVVYEADRDGSALDTVTLTEVSTISGNIKAYVGVLDISGQGAGSNMRLKATCKKGGILIGWAADYAPR